MSTRPGELTKDSWERQHDAASRAVRLEHTLTLTFSLYCALTLSAPDALLLDKNASLPLPIAGTTTSFTMFLLVAPLIHTALFVHLQIAYGYLQSLGTPPPGESRPLPFIFNMDSMPARGISFALTYLLAPANLLFFAWKASPLEMQGPPLLWLAIAVSFASLLLLTARAPWGARTRARAIAIVAVALIGIGCEAIATSGSFSWRRALDLSRADLTGRVFESLDLSGSTLTRADLSRSSLIDVNLQGANLTEARIAGAILKSTDFRGATLTGATFEGTRGENVLMSGATCAHCVLTNAHFTGGRWDKADCAECSLVDATLLHLSANETSWQGAQLSDTSFEDVELHGADFSRAALQAVRFRSTYMSDVNFDNATIEDVKFESCTLVHSDLNAAQRPMNYEMANCHVEE